MGRIYDALDDGLRRWIGQQHLFFVATAPDEPEGHINLSPKDTIDCLSVLDPTTVAYVDMLCSGIETVAHLRQNGRIVLMFCAFAGPPKIVRLHGRDRVVPVDDPEFARLIAAFPPNDDVRSIARGIVVIEVDRIADSCGFAVPRMDHVADRRQLFQWAETQRAKRGDGWERDYIRAKNAQSIDGLEGLDVADSPTGAGADPLVRDSLR